MSATIPARIPVTGTWKIDSVHSSATFTVGHHRVATFRGHFHEVSGALENGVLSGSLHAESIDVGPLPMFREHLLGADWFDIENHQTLSFSSTDLHAHGDHLHAAGELTIKGVTKPVEISGNVRGPVAVPNRDGSSSDRLGVDLTTTVNRREFGLTGEGGAADAVTIEVSLELVAQ
ncbi:MAG: YceI family protein [Solirubrobacteraceae bacterium]